MSSPRPVSERAVFRRLQRVMRRLKNQRLCKNRSPGKYDWPGGSRFQLLVGNVVVDVFDDLESWAREYGALRPDEVMQESAA